MKRAAICTLIPLFFVAACSGTDNSFSDENEPPPQPTGLAIDADNAMAVASAAYGAAVDSGELAGLAGTTGLGAAKPTGSSKPLAQPQTNGLLRQVVEKVPLGTDEYECLSSGTVAITIDIVDPLVLAAGALSVGDNFLVVYTNCDDGAGEIVDGTIDMTVSAFTGDVFSGLYDMTMAMVVTTLQVTTSTDVLTSDGDAAARLNLLDLPYAEAVVNGNSMTMDSNSSSDTLTDYSSMQTVDAGPAEPPYTMETQGTLVTTRLAGSIDYSTPVVFSGLGGNYPYTGEFLVVGENSSVRLVVDNDVDIHIDIDSNGDGVIDQTVVTTWAEFTSM